MIAMQNLFTRRLTLAALMCVLALAALCAPAHAQGDKPKKKAELTPGTSVLPTNNSLQWQFVPGHIFQYEYHDSTRVHRVYSDSSLLDYERHITYYIQMRALKAPEDGITELNVVVDSIAYRFKSGEDEMIYDNRHKKELTFPDLLAAVIPVGYEFNIKLSPYWEAVSVHGEMLDWLHNYIEDNGAGHLDSMRKFMWYNGLSTMPLAQLSDMQKGALPNGRVGKDSIWKKPYFVKVDGLDARDDSAASQITGYGAGVYTIETNSKTLKVLPQSQRIYRIESMVDVLGGEGKGKQVLKLTRRGEILESASDFVTTLKAKVRKEVFQQTVESHYRWKLNAHLEY